MWFGFFQNIEIPTTLAAYNQLQSSKVNALVEIIKHHQKGPDRPPLRVKQEGSDTAEIFLVVYSPFIIYEFLDLVWTFLFYTPRS